MKYGLKHVKKIECHILFISVTGNWCEYDNKVRFRMMCSLFNTNIRDAQINGISECTTCIIDSELIFFVNDNSSNVTIEWF